VTGVTGEIASLSVRRQSRTAASAGKRCPRRTPRQHLDDCGATRVEASFHDIAFHLAADFKVKTGQVRAKVVKGVEQFRFLGAAGAQRELARRESLEDEDAA